MHSKHGIAGLVLIAASLTFSCRRAPRVIEREVMAQHEKVKRGAYLATVGGCNDCHTPGGLYGAPDATRRLSGSDLGWRGPWGTSYAPNLSPDVETGLGSWSEQEIVRAIQKGVSRDGHVVRPPMPWPSFAHYTDEDALAIAAYLKSLPPVSHRVPPALPPNETPVGAVLAIPPPPAWDAPKSGGVGGGPPHRQ
jgi:mono/diheme cytochrome c family protein